MPRPAGLFPAGLLLSKQKEVPVFDNLRFVTSCKFYNKEYSLCKRVDGKVAEFCGNIVQNGGLIDADFLFIRLVG